MTAAQARKIARQAEAAAELQRMLTVSRMAVENRLPGETLHAATRRLERSMAA